MVKSSILELEEVPTSTFKETWSKKGGFQGCEFVSRENRTIVALPTPLKTFQKSWSASLSLNAFAACC